MARTRIVLSLVHGVDGLRKALQNVAGDGEMHGLVVEEAQVQERFAHRAARVNQVRVVAQRLVDLRA